MLSPGRPITALLQAWRGGDQGALNELLPIVYAELYRLADRQLRDERPGHTFRPTDLVSEAYLRLTSGTTPAVNDRAHFFAMAARSMRQILTDHARRRTAQKRGSDARRVPLEEGQLGPARTDDLVALDDALRELGELDERKARMVELHYFAGLTQEEMASVLGVHVNTVARDLRLAAAWLRRYMRDS